MIRDNQRAATSAIFRLHRPFFDLNPVTEAPLSSQVPLLAYHNLDKEYAQGLQRYLTERFRFSLITESGLHQYALLTPLEVPKRYRTVRWQHLCDLTEGFSDLPSSKQIMVLYLLLALSFHRLILKLIPTNMISIMHDEYSSEIAYIRAFVLYRLSIDTCEQVYHTKGLEEVLQKVPYLSHVRFQAAMALLVHSAKVCKDVATTRHYRSVLTPYIDATHHDKSSFAYYMLNSRFLRAASFEPFLEGDCKRLKAEMNEAEQLARNAPTRTEEEQLIAKENLYSVLESRMREALWLGDLDMAQARLEENIRINPYDSKTHIEMGTLFLQQGNFIGAASEYAQATQYSPPGSAPAYYMLGYCQEQLGNIEQALECYQASLHIDADGISPVQGLLRTAKRLGKNALFHWAEERAIQLTKTGHISPQELVSLA